MFPVHELTDLFFLETQSADEEVVRNGFKQFFLLLIGSYKKYLKLNNGNYEFEKDLFLSKQPKQATYVSRPYNTISIIILITFYSLWIVFATCKCLNDSWLNEKRILIGTKESYIILVLRTLINICLRTSRTCLVHLITN
jgi:hypothetical protein